MMYTKEVSVMLTLARTIPIERTILPPSDSSMKPKTCSIRLRIVEICLLLFFCLAVRGAPFLPYSLIIGGKPALSNLSSFSLPL